MLPRILPQEPMPVMVDNHLDDLGVYVPRTVPFDQATIFEHSTNSESEINITSSSMDQSTIKFADAPGSRFLDLQHPIPLRMVSQERLVFLRGAREIAAISS